MSDAALMLIGGALLAAAVIAALIADRVRVPGLVLFLALGMLVGSEGIGRVAFDNAELTRTLGTVGLALILFEGGLAAGWAEIRPVLGTAISLATIGTVLTSVLAGLAATLIFDLSTLEGLIIGSAVAATDSAAIFAVLRGSRLKRNLARSLEGESGMNDPVAVLLVTSFIAWIQQPGYGLEDMVPHLVEVLALGAAIGLGIGWIGRAAIRRLDLPSDGLYPVASIAIAALAYGVTQELGGSGFLAVYIAGLAVGTGSLPAKRTIIDFQQGLSWVAQIALFFMLGLLVHPSGLIDVALKGLALSAVLMLLARPLSTVVATALSPFNLRERLMLGWAGLRGAVPIWLATLPVVAGVEGSSELFNVVFFVVVTSTLVQGTTFEGLASRLGLTTTEPALPQPLVESGVVRELGADVVAFRVPDDAVIVGHAVRELGLPREALVNVIVRGGEALPPRGSTEVEAGDELHILVRTEARGEVQALQERWRNGPLSEPARPGPSHRGASQIFTVAPWPKDAGDPSDPHTVRGVPVHRKLRTRRDQRGALVTLADGRYAVTGERFFALGGRHLVARWCGDRVARASGGAELAWWQEVAGVLNAPAARR